MYQKLHQDGFVKYTVMSKKERKKLDVKRKGAGQQRSQPFQQQQKNKAQEETKSSYIDTQKDFHRHCQHQAERPNRDTHAEAHREAHTHTHTQTSGRTRRQPQETKHRRKEERKKKQTNKQTEA